MSEDKTEKKESKAFELYELRKELMNIDYTLKLVEKNCSTLNVSLKKGEIVQKELEALSDDTRVYSGCGRMFVLSNKTEAINNLVNNRKKMIDELNSQNDKKKYLEKNLDEQSKAYLELIKNAEKK